MSYSEKITSIVGKLQVLLVRDAKHGRVRNSKFANYLWKKRRSTGKKFDLFGTDITCVRDVTINSANMNLFPFELYVLYIGFGRIFVVSMISSTHAVPSKVKTLSANDNGKNNENNNNNNNNNYNGIHFLQSCFLTFSGHFAHVSRKTRKNVRRYWHARQSITIRRYCLLPVM